MKSLKSIKSILTIFIFVSLIMMFLGSSLNKDLFNEKYGFSVATVGAIFLIGEIAFTFGIILMLKSVGILKYRLKDILKFDFSSTRFDSREFISGFIINRLAAFIPWAYILGVGWRNLPYSITGLIMLELLVVIILTLGVFEYTNKNVAKKS